MKAPFPTEVIESIARICHEANRALCVTLGDRSQKPWDEVSVHQKRMIRAGVDIHLQSDLTPEQSHERWLAAKEADGWTYGAKKDEAAKKHPSMVPYMSLPEEIKLKDYLFTGIVHTIKDFIVEHFPEEKQSEPKES